MKENQGNPHNIVLIDDDHVDREIILRHLSKSEHNFTITEFDNALKALEHCQKNEVDCILIDYYLPSMDGLEFVKSLKKSSDKSKIFNIIMLTGQGNEEIAVNALKAGAKDYLNKNSLTAVRLVNTIINSIRQYELEKEISSKNEKIEYIASHDVLTSLPNRTAFEKRIKQYFSAAVRYERLSALLMVDLNNFKSINDSMGHLAGDEVLTEIAKRIAHNIRASDMAARLGGDEFVIILDEINEESDAGIVADKILQEFLNPFYIGENSIYVSASIGICCFPMEIKDYHEVISRADVAMYQAKKFKESNYQYYRKEDYQLYLNTLKIAQELDHSLEKDELYLVYQPIINIETKEVLGFEALCRWYNKSLERELMPDEFIPIAEKNGFIHRLGFWLLETAYNQLLEWQDKYNYTGYLSINLSTLQLVNTDFFTEAKKFLNQYPSLKEKMHFEISEHTAMKPVVQANKILDKIHQSHIKLHIDDFGTGYSSLNYLKILPVDYLKIDKSFIHDIGKKNNDLLVYAILAIAKALSLGVIAEGVETKKQLDFLSEADCVCAQGFYFYRPMKIHDASALLKKNSQ